MVQMNLQNENGLSLREETYACQGQGLEKEIVREFGTSLVQVHTAIFKMDNQQGPTV